MKFTRRRILLIVWAVSILFAGMLVSSASGVDEYGVAVMFSLVAISLGIPLMRAFTEFSK